MRNYLIIDGADSRDFGVYISGQGTFSAPARAYNMLTVPGRDGELIGPERRFQNIEVTYPAFIFSNFNSNIEAFRNFLLSRDGYVRIADSYHTDEFRLGVYRGPFTPDVVQTNDAGSFDIVFNCKPQRFLLSGEEITTIPIVNQEYTITNPTQFPSRPLIEMAPRPNSEAISTGNIVIGDTTLTMTNIPADVGLIIDCEMMDVYGTDGLNYNSHIALSGYDFPVFRPGTNGLTRYNVGVLSIKGRWFVV